MASRTLQIPLDEILDLVNAADGGGYGRDVLLSSLAEFCGFVSDEEIAAYADGFLSPESRSKGYGEDDRDNAVEVLTGWRDRYSRSAVGG